MVRTRFAPSPTGMLHLGAARTALFNWLYARHHGGEFVLRIEDTDRERSTREAVEAILEGMRWLGLESDQDPFFQSHAMLRHQEVAWELYHKGMAYKCYATPEEVEAMREKARAEGKPPRYNGLWREKEPGAAQENQPFVLRFKSPQTGETVIQDLVQGEVKMQNELLDDLVLLRSDGTPTYMLSVVVDDHDMEITHILRGDDHLTNTFRQYHLYQAMGWEIPQVAHIPLIHGQDGGKLSKRHGAVGVGAYREMGILPEAMANYLLRLGWGHGDEEVIPQDRAIELFDTDGLGKSPSRFDLTKLMHLNGIYLREAHDTELAGYVKELLEKQGVALDKGQQALLERAMPGLKVRAKDLNELADSALVYFKSPIELLDEKAEKFLTPENLEMLEKFANVAQAQEAWDHEVLEQAARDFAEAEDLKLGKVAQPLRAKLTGRTISPSVFEVMELLGKEESLKRLRAVL